MVMMDSSQDTEITLGTAKLLGLFFGLVIVCAVFFALGYTLGRKSEVGLNPASAAAPLPTPYNGSKPASSQATQPMTFYKAVEQKDASAQLAPAAAPGGDSATAASSAGPAASTQTSSGSNPPDPLAAIPSGGYFVQVAAVSKQDDAQALVDALKKKQYPAFVADNSAADKLFRVQLGPFAEIKDAEAMRSRLVNDGYTPILKK
jgi:cell division septation protein DedD